MKTCLLLLVVAAINYSYGGIVPASTTLIRSSSSITHSPSIIYSQQRAPLALAYSAPITYAHHAVAPSLYTQRLLAPAHYVSQQLLQHRPVFAQQSIIAQYPALVAQSPVLAQYPIAQAPVIGQHPIAQAPVIEQYPIVQAPVIGQYPGAVQGPSQIPTQDGSLAIEAPDSPQNLPPQLPIQPPQQSPILSGGAPGAILDDDTVSIESA